MNIDVGLRFRLPGEHFLGNLCEQVVEVTQVKPGEYVCYRNDVVWGCSRLDHFEKTAVPADDQGGEVQ